jgi:hypothetical protein
VALRAFIADLGIGLGGEPDQAAVVYPVVAR